MGKSLVSFANLLYVAGMAMFVAGLAAAGYLAYDIRLYAIKNYGLVIHEFDPWFNFRATQYLAANGWTNFFHWFDYQSWYPLGRPVGTTIYPGMQISSVAIWNTLNWLGDKYAMSLNDVCVYVPCWFGVSATTFLGLMAAECSGSWAAGVASAMIMSIVPAHFMRSVGGGYDNESVAMTAMCMTFYCWVRALREDPKKTNGEATRDSYVWGVLTALAYIYMVAAWGGFVFVLNLVGIHAAILVACGRFSSKLHRAYSLFYFLGTIGAIQVPVVGWAPLKSLEQLGPCVVFIAFQLLEYCEQQRRTQQLGLVQVFKLRVKCFLPVFVACVCVVIVLLPTGYFGPLSARVRGLFVKHTRTGNPLVDSVAEHQPASAEAYQHYLHHVYHLAPVGFGLSFLKCNDANSFVIVYAVVAYYFSNKMARLVILLGPVASALGGVVIGFCVDQLLLKALGSLLCPRRFNTPFKAGEGIVELDVDDDDKASKDNKKKKKVKAPRTTCLEDSAARAVATNYIRRSLALYNSPPMALLRLATAVMMIKQFSPKATEFYDNAHTMSEGMSQPSIMYKARLRSGEEIMVDDYRESYFWLRDNTPEDARVMAWWDYGYQIAGMANRTTIADGNTWNHEHIATLGRCLSAPEKRAHRIARHLADYVLVWAGGGGDDLAKSPHMARIGNSVYPDICPDDPTCSKFGFYSGGVPTPMMKKSLLYKMTQVGYKPEIKLDKNKFTHVYTSKYGKVRIFKVQNVDKKSKEWVANPDNRICDAPGSWYCTGQYPPALQPLIEKRKNFKQIGDFNVEKDSDSDKYQEEYHARMSGKKPKGAAADKTKPKKPKAAPKKSEFDDEDEDDEEAAPVPPPVKYVGCVGAEALLGEERVYGGGSSGASPQLAYELARDRKKRYVAIARSGASDGHSFAFDALPTTGLISDGGCTIACPFFDMPCGCSDALCGEHEPVAGEDHRRRWALYEVLDAAKENKGKNGEKKGEKKAKGKKNKGKKNKAKSEL